MVNSTTHNCYKTEVHILHCDLDAFFAAVEQRDNPELKGKPVIVGGEATSRGVVSTCSYEAREYGVHSAMPTAQARRLCPRGVFLPVNMEHYQEVSRQVFSILADYTPNMEILSIDEAFLDVGGSISLFGTPEQIAVKIKERICSEVGLTISVGISYNKFLAKLASDIGKPDGLMVILPQHSVEFLRPLPVSRLWGIGEKTATKLENMGIRTIADLQELPSIWLSDKFGTAGRKFWEMAHGIDDRPVQPNYDRKSLGREITFPQDVADISYFHKLLELFASELCRKLRQDDMDAATITVKLRFSNFHTITRSETIQPSNSERIISALAGDILDRNYQQQPLRLLGLCLGRLSPVCKLQQGSLFGENDTAAHRNMDQIVDEIQARFGVGAIKWANLLDEGNRRTDK